jgi:UDPglucose--hexose-1-phosphate uridylyltransferase
MSELRHDPLSGDDVIVAAGRAARPTTFATNDSDAAGIAGCPFCPGHEEQTPPEVLRTGAGVPGTPGWRVRAFPNLYPIVGDGPTESGITGAHEVVVLSPDHRRSFAGLDDDEAVEAVCVWRDRMRFHLDDGAQYAVAILNHLRAAGASIAHPHAQVFALDVVPPTVSGALLRARAAGTDLVMGDWTRERLTVARDQVVVWCPFASTSPYLVRIAHEAASARFDRADDATVVTTALALRDTLARLQSLLGDVPYNVVVRTAPRDEEPFHWYVDVIPRISVIAGFEQATGILVNTVPPELAAQQLNEVGP